MNHFPQIRRDPIIDRRVLIAPERAAKPTELLSAKPATTAVDCPFCEGNESETPPEVLAVGDLGREPNQPGWKVRVVANRYPAVRHDSQPNESVDSLFHSESAIGRHEVIIESPRHDVSFSQLSREQLICVFTVWRDRLLQLRDEGRTVYAQLFKNHGASAGASVEHVHSQLIGLPAVPPLVRCEYAAAEDYWEAKGECIYCALVDHEFRLNQRVVEISEHMAAITAYAARFPYETWLVPRNHGMRFEDATAEELAELARLVHHLVKRLDELETDPSYNLALHTAPLAGPQPGVYHWHMEWLPRLTGVAGFEWGAGMFINPLPPEEAAARLRK